MQLNRRDVLLRTLFGAGGVGLRAFVTGVPLRFLLQPKAALAMPAAYAGGSEGEPAAQRLLVATSCDGDPINANVPGTYDHAGIVHADAAPMAPTSIWQGGRRRLGAACWAGLPQPLLERTAFFHHATFTTVHGQGPASRRLAGAVAGTASLVELLATSLAARLDAAQRAPIAVGACEGSTAAMASGQMQPTLTPLALAAALRGQDFRGGLIRMRQATLQALHADGKAHAPRPTKSFLHSYGNAPADLEAALDALYATLDGIKDNGVAGQLLAASALFQLNVTPAVTVHVPFGGDNHVDDGLRGEAAAHVRGVGAIAAFYHQLQAAKLANKVTFLSLNVFGRTLSAQHKGRRGRDHNADHHAAVLIGANVRGGVVGGVAPSAVDYAATAIDSASGEGVPEGHGDVPFGQTFAAMGKTVGRAVGVDEAFLAANITGGKVVRRALQLA